MIRHNFTAVKRDESIYISKTGTCTSDDWRKVLSDLRSAHKLVAIKRGRRK